MLPWRSLARAVAEDGTSIELRQRGGEYLLLAGGRDLMSSADEASSRALARLALGARDAVSSRVLVGGLGMGFTLREALDLCGPEGVVAVAELVPEVVEFNRRFLGRLAGDPLADPRCRLQVGDVFAHIAATTTPWDAILLDVDNGPDALAHGDNERLYDARGIAAITRALRPGGVLGLWSFSDDPRFSERLRRAGHRVEVHRVPASRSGRGRYHYVWIAARDAAASSAARVTARRTRRR